jgi:outer membrane protein TolC
MLASRFWLGIVGNPLPTAVLFVLLLFASRALGQSAPVSPDQPWHASDERKIEADAKNLRDSRFNVEPGKTYSLAELVNLAEAHNPETRLAWEHARSQAAALGVARSELYPTLAAAALSDRPLGSPLRKPFRRPGRPRFSSGNRPQLQRL